MHIPDGFLTTPVWATLDAIAIPAVAWTARRAQSELESPDDRRIPLLGVMGAFVFAAQMINFPVGLGTSGHLVGGTLLAITLGPAAAVVVMTAILILQALIFQDGGLVVLGANVLNMAVVGVLAGYLPYRLAGRGKARSAAIFLGGFCSVAASASLALAELLVSGVPMARQLLWFSAGLFLVSGVIEGAITAAATRAIEGMNPLWIREARPARPVTIAVAVLGAAGLLAAGIAVASSAPDALQALLPGSKNAGIPEGRLTKIVLGLAAMILLYAACVIAGRRIARQRSA